jgi:hypothetical protein
MWRHRIVALIALGAALACNGDGTGPGGASRTRVLLTDAPFPFDQVGSVNVYVVSVAAARNADTTSTSEPDWITIAEPRRTFDLLDLQAGKTALVGEGDLPANEYNAVRMIIDVDQSSITYTDGSPAPVNWQGSGEKTLYALVEQPLSITDGPDGSQIIIDFDVGRSFLLQATVFPGTDGFLFIPWIRAVNEAVTGTIVGTVRGVNGANDVLEAVPNASITVFRRFPGSAAPIGYTAATGRTDADGNFAIHYVSAGDYAVSAAPPSGFDAAVGLSTDVTVTAGMTTSVEVTLPSVGTGGGAALYLAGPNRVAVNTQAPFAAVVFSASGDSILNPPVIWTSRTPSVGTIAGLSSTAEFSALALGSTWVVAQSQGLADSIMVSVVQSDSTGGGGNTGPVATVELMPASQTVSVGDSLGLWATLKNAQGQSLGGRTVTWSASDSAVVRFDFAMGQSAVLRARKAGSATITAVSEGKSGTATVTVR